MLIKKFAIKPSLTASRNSATLSAGTEHLYSLKRSRVWTFLPYRSISWVHLITRRGAANSLGWNWIHRANPKTRRKINF